MKTNIKLLLGLIICSSFLFFSCSVEGRWNEVGNNNYLEIEESFGVVTGRYYIAFGGSFGLIDGRYQGDRLTFEIEDDISFSNGYVTNNQFRFEETDLEWTISFDLTLNQGRDKADGKFKVETTGYTRTEISNNGGFITEYTENRNTNFTTNIAFEKEE